MRIIVTGASGFIGGALVTKLRQLSGTEIIPVSRSRHPLTTLSVENYTDAPPGDVLVHLAEDSDRLRVNKMGEAYKKQSAAVLGALLTKRYPLVVYGSSSVVYGEEGTALFREDDRTAGIDTYTDAKLCNERTVLDAAGVVARFTNVLGFEMAQNNVAHDILAQIPGSGALIVRNEKPIRDFIWIDDVVDALHRLIMGQSCGVFNIGSGIGISIKELAVTALEQAHESFRPVQSSQRALSESANVVDITKSRSQLDWSPQVSIDVSLRLLLRKGSNRPYSSGCN